MYLNLILENMITFKLLMFYVCKTTTYKIRLCLHVCTLYSICLCECVGLEVCCIHQ